MKEITYKTYYERELCLQGNICGFPYYIINLGTHPVAYVAVPNTHPYYGKDEIDLDDIPVHGGVTYTRGYLKISDNETIGGNWFIGWDYAHCDDYTGTNLILGMNNGEKYNIQKILIDVLKCITLLLEKIVYKEETE